MGEKILYRISVKGRVQGVGFRWSALKEATGLGLTGFVKNMPDGSVYAEAEGARENLDSFLEWCRKGPGHGHVQSVEYTAAGPEGYKDFFIKH